MNKKAQLTQRERATAVHVWRPPAKKCKIRKNLYLVLKVIQGHCFRCQSKPMYDFLLVINCNLGPISHRFRDMATFTLKSLPPRAVQPFKVIDLGLNGKPIGDFLLVINCNLGPISHRFRDMASYWFQIAKFSYPPLIWGPRLGWPLWNFWKSVTDPETRVFGAGDGEDLMILACTVSAWSTRVTDRQTDRQTELRWLRRAIAVPAVVRKNLCVCKSRTFHRQDTSPCNWV